VCHGPPKVGPDAWGGSRAQGKNQSSRQATKHKAWPKAKCPRPEPRGPKAAALARVVWVVGRAAGRSGGAQWIRIKAQPHVSHKGLTICKNTIFYTQNLYANLYANLSLTLCKPLCKPLCKSFTRSLQMCVHVFAYLLHTVVCKHVCIHVFAPCLQ
jgi:hypothetical protein